MADSRPKNHGTVAIGLRLRDAVALHAADRNQGRNWHVVGGMAEMGDALSDFRIGRWADQHIALTDEVLAYFRSGRWWAEGIRRGGTTSERLSVAWWQRPVKLDLWRETVEWDGDDFRGLMVYAGAHSAAPVSISRKPPSLAAVNAWMLRHAIEYKKMTRTKLAQPAAVKECCDIKTGPGASVRMARKAYACLPPHLKFGQGERHPGK